jgi:hypothetical protein
MYSDHQYNGVSNGNGCAKGDQCCKNKVNGVTANGDCSEDEAVLFNKTEYMPYDPSQEPIFPPELRVCMLCFVEERIRRLEIMGTMGGKEQHRSPLFVLFLKLRTQFC